MDYLHTLINVFPGMLQPDNSIPSLGEVFIVIPTDG